MNSFIPVCQPFLDGNERKYVLDCIESGWISSSGGYVDKFESAFSEYCTANYAVGVCNGTVALHLALAALGIKEGDEVIIPDFTMIATAFAVCYTGAKPVFVDANKENWNIDIDRIEEKITKKTKAIMVVSVFGQPCDMDNILSIAAKYGLYVIEDAAESHGAEYKRRKTGSLADITAFSFFANKNLTTGEGGMVLTNNEKLYDKVRYLKNMCFPLDGLRNYMHHDIGFNYRLTNIHAAIGLAQVEKADYYKTLRMKNHSIYFEFLKNVDGIVFQKEIPDVIHVHWMNAVVVDPNVVKKSRDEIMSLLKANGIDTRLLFVGMHRQPSLINYGCVAQNENFPVTDWLSENGFYLPSASNLKAEEIEFVCDTLKHILS